MEEDTLAQLVDLLSLPRLLHIAAIAALAWVLLHLVHRGLQRLMQRFPRYRLQMGQLFPVIRILTWALVVGYVIFGIVRPPQTIVFAVLGSLGLAIGLAAQGGVRNLLAGIMMIFNPPFRVGDMVRFGGHYGEVTRLDLSVTWLRTLDDNVVMVPNAVVLDNAVANANSGELSEMVVVSIDLPRDVPLRLVRELALDAARSSPYSFLKKPITVLLEARHDLDFLVRVIIKAYVVDVRYERRLASDVTERFLDAFRAVQPDPSAQSAPPAA
ncbi:MAG: mechanosensitive ion channel [Pseudomonadales bacterium]